MNIKEARRIVSESTLAGVVELLETLGSDKDPIFYKREETTPEGLSYKLGWYTKAADCRISFYGIWEFGSRLRKNSTFAQMLRDRTILNQRIHREDKRESRKPVVEYIVSWKEWKGVEPCGKTEWKRCSKKFTKRSEAKALFVHMRTHYDHAKFQKVTTELLNTDD